MAKRSLSIVAAVITVVIVAAVIILYSSYSTPPVININYSSKYGNTQYSGFNTYILFYLNVTASKSCRFDFGTLQVTCNGQPVTLIAGSGPNVISLQSGQVNSVQLDYQVSGDVIGNFQLTYNGTEQVTLSGLNSVPVQG
jgi:hypothetical protein